MCQHQTSLRGRAVNAWEDTVLYNTEMLVRKVHIMNILRCMYDKLVRMRVYTYAYKLLQDITQFVRYNMIDTEHRFQLRG